MRDMTTLEQAVGMVLRLLRKERGLKLRESSQRAGISLGYLSQIEIGKNEASFGTVQKLAASYGLLMSDLIARAEKFVQQPDRQSMADSMARELEM